MNHSTIISDLDREEAAEGRAPARPADAISLALGTATFVRTHRFGDLCFHTEMGRSPRLPVSRYYWSVAPPTAVDFAAEVQHGQREVDAKRAYFATRGVRYVLARDEWDEEAFRRVPAAVEAAEPVPVVVRPATSTRRRRNPREQS